jgi:TNF receptor-associated factor 3
MDLRMQCVETTNYDGVLIWKVAHYARRKRDAASGGTLSLYSQPFYTSRYGYKMCARVYLNGDGAGKGSHVSFFFVVMQGDYDDLVSWPFRQRVTLSLMDQRTPQRRHLADTFRPDPTSTSFQKPTTAMNVASGCPKFIEHSRLEAADSPFLVNDILYFKITVDISDLSNP